MRSFVKIKSSRNAEITLSFTYICKSCPCREFLATQICLNAVRENKIIAKISGFTVVCVFYVRDLWYDSLHMQANNC